LLSYFKLNDPFRLVPLLLLAFLFKLPVFFNLIQYAEVTHWFVIGEAMQGGSMYTNIWDGLAPFSASIYQAFTWLFGRSIIMLYVLGTLLTFIQAAIINNFSIRAKIFENNTYLPAFVYVLFTSSHPAFFTLSPTLMGLTFVLLGLGNLLSHVEFRAKQDIQIVMIGLYLGSSTLFYFPYIVVIPISLILLAFFTNTLLRRYFLLLFSNFFPIISAFLYYWIISDHPGYFIYNFIKTWNFNAYYPNIGWGLGVIILFIPLLFFVVGLLSFGNQRRLTNYQSRVVQFFFFLGVFLMSMLLIENPITHYSLVVYLVISTFVAVHFISLFKRTLYIILLNLFIIVGPFVSLWSATHNWFPQFDIKAPSLESNKAYQSIIKNKSIMVLGSAKDLYTEAKLAGPFYDWGLSKDFFAHLDYYDNIVFLHKQLRHAKPQVIIDLENIWPTIEKQLPLIAKEYYQVQSNVWVRRP